MTPGAKALEALKAETITAVMPQETLARQQGKSFTIEMIKRTVEYVVARQALQTDSQQNRMP